MADSYHVLPQGQRVSTQLSPTGQGFTSVREVTFMVDSGPAQGTVGTVSVPADVATADTIRQAIEAEVAHLTAVASL